MRGKLWFVGGLAVGFVLGARAGRERYEELVLKGRQVLDHPTVQEAAGVAQAQASRLYTEGKDRLSHTRLGEKIALGNGSSSESDTDDSGRTNATAGSGSTSGSGTATGSSTAATGSGTASGSSTTTGSSTKSGTGTKSSTTAPASRAASGANGTTF
ncbi:hypothetical protein V1634_29685 [Plantactinospora veratri]|uniref:Protoporphyrinogen oxidase n=1 Tax=Plantactinospora veratri TaxID=1436122 RepID=A0ABU7SM55_9ACTN